MAVGLVLLAGSLRAEFAYVLSQNINTLLAYRIGSNGALTPVPGSPFRTGVFPISMALDFWGRFAYVVNQGSQNISIYTIDANGALTFIGFGPGAGGRFGGPIAISP